MAKNHKRKSLGMKVCKQFIQTENYKNEILINKEIKHINKP